VELDEVMRTTGTVRYFRTDPVPTDVLYRVFDRARFAPQGGNRQPLHWIVVRDVDTRRQLQSWYEPVIRASFEAYAASAGIDLSTGQLPVAARGPLHLAEHLHEVPVIAFPCVDIGLLRPGSSNGGPADLAATTFIDGGHVFPAVQNLLLACRDEGLGTALTSGLTVDQDRIRDLLALPDTSLVAAAIAIGWPARAFPTRLRRLPVHETVYAERYNHPLFTPPNEAA
jgi:nitroreductase